MADAFPTKEVTRAEAAKIIAYLMIGDSREADALKTTSDPFSDVSKNHWAAGYIAYLVQEGVLDGVGGGKFDPNGKVTGLAFAKMLLTALGYGVNDEYVGTDWAINVAKDALNYGIYDGNLAGANNEAATREECALYAFNTLELNKVTYSALLGGYIHNGDLFNAESNKADSFANDFGLDDEPVDSDAFCRPQGYVWKVGKKVISNTYGADAYLEGAYTVPVSGNELYNLLGKSVVNKIGTDYELNVYVDGVYTKVSDEWIEESITKANTSKLERTGYGVDTKIYVFPKSYKDDLKTDTDTAEIRICLVDTVLAQVSDVQEETKKKDAKTTFTVADIPADDHLVVLESADLTYETDEYAEGELVLLTVSGKESIDKAEVISVVPATLLDGKITKYTNKGVAKITADGEEYTGAENDFVVKGTPASDIDEKEVKGKTYTMILDEYGYVIGLTNDPTVPNTYVYVAQFGQKIDTTGSLSDKTTLAAEIWVADEESETGASKQIVLVDYAKSDIGTTFDAESFDGNFDAIVKVLNGDVEGQESGIGLYKYSKNASNGKAILTRLTAKDTNFFELSELGWEVQKGISRLNGDNYMTTKTQFFYVTGTYGTSSFKVNVYNGINKVPTLDKDVTKADLVEGWAADYDKYRNFEAMLVDYTAKTTAVTSDDYLYIGTYFKAENEDGKFDVSLDVMKDGELTTLDFTNLSSDDADTLIAKADTDYVNEYITKNGAKDIKAAADASNGSVTYVDAADGTVVINEIYKVGDVYETTLYVDGVTVPTYMENAKIVDLREYTEADGYEIGTLSMKALAKITETEDVTVAFQYNKYLEVTVIYVISSVEK